MNVSFYTAALGAMAQNTKMDVIGNNLSNTNTKGYKAKSAVFSDLVYRNFTGQAVNGNLQAGVGVKIQGIKTDFSGRGFEQTDRDYDFAIEGDGYFMLQNPGTGEITYTRDGHFGLSESNQQDEYGNPLHYLITDNGKRVLDFEGQPVMVELKFSDSEDKEDGAAAAEEEAADDETKWYNTIGVYRFPIQDGIVNVGSNELAPAIVREGEGPRAIDNSCLYQGALEVSGVDTPTEFSRMIETQRAFSFALKMIQTSDEVENLINTVRM